MSDTPKEVWLIWEGGLVTSWDEEPLGRKSKRYLLDTGTLRETVDCPVCVSPHPHNEEWFLTEPGPCWRCHGERRVIV